MDGPDPPRGIGRRMGSPGAVADGAPGLIRRTRPSRPTRPIRRFPRIRRPAPRRGLRTGIAVAVAVVVLASIGVGVYALAGNGSGSGSTANSQGPGGQGGGPAARAARAARAAASAATAVRGRVRRIRRVRRSRRPRPSQSEAPKIESGSVTDAIDGISLPIPDDWYGQQIRAGASVTSNDSYKCPGDTSKTCTKGGAYSAPALALGTAGSTAEAGRQGRHLGERRGVLRRQDLRLDHLARRAGLQGRDRGRAEGLPGPLEGGHQQGLRRLCRVARLPLARERPADRRGPLRCRRRREAVRPRRDHQGHQGVDRRRQRPGSDV